ncbi:PIR protein, putative [Plasmodium sp. gorilla clade G1]|nr:PIR protein, putative [Plasmodium sp. gorilla clade G1]
MKIHCYNILLFSLLLHTFLLSSSQVNIEMNHYNTPHMKNREPTKSYRSLCECELYTSIYDDDPDMKEIMHDFDRQTSQRFEEYNERMNKNRQKCKEQCDRDIQKIILKDKIAKELKQQLAPLETDISTDDIPTCVCENSVADKVEKTCLKCGGVLGGAVPELGLLCGYGAYELVQAAIAAGIDFATKEGFKAGTKVGIQAAIEGVIDKFSLQTLGGKTLDAVITSKTYNQPLFLVEKLVNEYKVMCETTIAHEETLMCSYKLLSGGKPIPVISGTARNVTSKAIQAAANETSRVTSTLTAQKTAEATSVTAIFSNPIVISFLVIVIVVIILLIIYLILRYRRKEKMKKKLQYIKLLK